ncbi:hypothetical protein FCH28_22960 [Streptomyces piniterrae]|uniref:Peptidase n=1 Tax=Streptomyces piniterrae TaxID=2571125 RepID=A0A4U0N965_9ACTN|nr:hypothetical protein [Streptomyces piniterrae]TJZ50173.1 hypothetical protein FCH28_22960 [Streptomyces piniterrae]
MVTGRTTNRGLAVLAALAVVALLPGTVGVASADNIPGYRPAEGAPTIKGSPSSANSPQIKPGIYRDSIKRGEEKRYAVSLDAKTSAYFSAVAAPTPGSKVEDYGDKLKIRLEDNDGTTCGSEASPTFRGGGTAYPLADYANRTIEDGSSECQEAGPYYLVISREGSATSGPDPWPIELDYLEEPPLKGSTPAKPGDGSWSTATPAPRTDPTKRSAKGGTGFNDAGSVASGVWKDRIRPGETRFYRVPVDWGQRLNLSAELPNGTSGNGSSAYVSNALGLGVYNPARGLVSADSFVSYSGKPATAPAFTAPVDYGNRFNSTDSVKAMRFAGWYYLEVTLNPDAAQYFRKGTDFTLRVDVRGEAKAGPGYAKPAGDFSVTAEDREMARTGQTAQEASKSGTLMTVAYAGIGTGVVLLAGLGAWTVVARRKAGAPAATGPALIPQQGQQLSSQASQPTLPSQQDQQAQFRPPQGW